MINSNKPVTYIVCMGKEGTSSESDIQGTQEVFCHFCNSSLWGAPSSIQLQEDNPENSFIVCLSCKPSNLPLQKLTEEQRNELYLGKSEEEIDHVNLFLKTMSLM